ncbi:pyridoxamine 5'-phosphate oxidase family protein [Bradyrhizobium commune]|uniref:Pyridoxamine 5'-phosphate oxidase family protein n=1 Tax=Bradyrhizobium commune TaxID=83627 RepID=A0A7S9GXY2_9BRAD|nr:pyridoxamine 5'-phosphate oxidase family protein [Bradyrhizobium commune]QPF89923.1 pyridoxamine 5'-phosphate oxidase family protein [Bradyrhizobium commune]
MLSIEDGQEPEHVERMLAGAKKVAAGVQYCWLLSSSDEGVCGRPMERLPPGENDDDWTIRFLTDLRSRKIAHLRRAPTVSLIFQDALENAFVGVTGAARLIERTSEIRALWKEDAHSRHFPTETDRANAGFIEVKIERIELWIKGVTPEPFGSRTTTLQRDPLGGWHLTT